MQSEQKKYIPWIDALKGIGILSVVIGHVFGALFVHLYHMPLFFLIAGYMYRPDENLWRFSRKKTIRLLIPYVSFFLLLSMSFILSGHAFSRNGMLYFGRFIYGGSCLKGELGTFWFVTVFYIALLLFNCLIRVRANWICCMTILLCAAYALEMMDIQLPEGLNVVPMALFFLFVGYKLRDIPIVNSRLFYYLSIPTLLMSAFFVESLYMDMKYAHYGIFIVSLFVSIVWTIAFAIFSHHIQAIKWLFAALVYLGKASLVIMFLHQFVHIRLRTYNVNVWLTFFISLIVPVLFYTIAVRFDFMKYIFLGFINRRK